MAKITRAFLFLLLAAIATAAAAVAVAVVIYVGDGIVFGGGSGCGECRDYDGGDGRYCRKVFRAFLSFNNNNNNFLTLTNKKFTVFVECIKGCTWIEYNS